MNVSSRRGEFLVVAHRGYSASYPENGREAFEASIRAGADLIETDVRLSADGTMFCSHDPDLERVLGTSRTIAELSDEALDALSVMRLSDVLDLARGRIGVLLDLKLKYRDYPVLVYDFVHGMAMQSSTVFGVRTVEQAEALHRHAPDAAILGFLPRSDDIPAFFAAGGGIARLWEDETDDAALAAARRAGNHPVWVTAGLRRQGIAPGDIDAARLRRLIDLGVDGLLVNDPAQALRLRAAQSAK